MSAAPLISIVIVTWNGRQFLEPCLEAVAAQVGVRTETILVDNASADGSADFVRERFPWVRVIELSENRGFAGGNNAGVAEARGEYVALLNNDTVAERDWLQNLWTGLDEAAGVALTTSKVVYMHDASIVDSAGDGMLRAGGAFKWHHGQSASLATESREVFGVCGAACLMPRAVFEELGGFDEAFFVSHEDVDLSYRARLRGYRCWYVAEAVVHHHGGASLRRMRGGPVFMAQRNLEWLYLKNTPLSILLRTLPSHLLYTLAALPYFAHQGLFTTFVRAKLAVLRDLGGLRRRRAHVQRTRTVSAAEIWRHLEAGWFGLKRREKGFDRGKGRRP